MYSYKFNATLVTQDCIDWIKNYFIKNGDKDTVAVIGISGGKDSSVAAALCVEALGPDRVIGVKMPQGIQEDIVYANAIINTLGINSLEIDIKDTCEMLYTTLMKSGIGLNDSVYSNLPARIRMTTLYAIAAVYHGRVVNTCNLSEDYVGYSTKFGDSAGDFGPLAYFTSDEVIEIGKELKIPEKFLIKTPSDGLCGKTDEENLGFTYSVLNRYIRKGILPDIDTLRNIEERHARNLHKLNEMPIFKYRGDLYTSC